MVLYFSDASSSSRSQSSNESVGDVVEEQTVGTTTSEPVPQRADEENGAPTCSSNDHSAPEQSSDDLSSIDTVLVFSFYIIFTILCLIHLSVITSFLQHKEETASNGAAKEA